MVLVVIALEQSYFELYTEYDFGPRTLISSMDSFIPFNEPYSLSVHQSNPPSSYSSNSMGPLSFGSKARGPHRSMLLNMSPHPLWVITSSLVVYIPSLLQSLFTGPQHFLGDRHRCPYERGNARDHVPSHPPLSF